MKRDQIQSWFKKDFKDLFFPTKFVYKYWMIYCAVHLRLKVYCFFNKGESNFRRFRFRLGSTTATGVWVLVYRIELIKLSNCRVDGIIDRRQWWGCVGRAPPPPPPPTSLWWYRTTCHLPSSRRPPPLSHLAHFPLSLILDPSPNTPYHLSPELSESCFLPGFFHSRFPASIACLQMNFSTGDDQFAKSNWVMWNIHCSTVP